MISINRPAIGALVLRPANGGAAIKLRLACALPALRVRLDIARQGPPGPVAQAGGSRPFLFIEVSAAQVLAKQILLPSSPQTEVLLDVVGGTLQKQNIDFVVTGNVLSWTGLSLELLLEAGNHLSISYT